LIKGKKEKLLLHACCAPCATHVMDVLSQSYTLTVLFYNPNIQPEDEYAKRLGDMIKLCDIKKTELLVPAYDPEVWIESTKGLRLLLQPDAVSLHRHLPSVRIKILRL